MLKLLILALIMVESGGDPNAVGDNGQAVGVLQIHPIMVQDVNRILGEEKFSLDDRYNRQKSIVMCKVYFNHYGKDKTTEQLARIWNGGPRGHKKESTKKYWKKVRRELEKCLKQK